VIGSGFGNSHGLISDHETLHTGGYKKISPYAIPKLLINMANGHITMKYGFKGPSHSVATACATGAHAIGDAANFISRGCADMIVAGSAESIMCPAIFAGFARAKSLSTKFNTTPHLSCRPFDVDRDGFVMGEGAGVLILEEFESALSRGAFIYGEIRGYGLSSDAYHITSPTPNGEAAQRCMSMALNQSGLAPSDIDYINCHATGTQVGDIAEVNAINEIFQGSTQHLSISSTKGATGHLLGAAGSVEAIITLLAMRYGIIPPTLNLVTPDPQITSNVQFVTTATQKKDIRAALTNSFGFGGTNACLVLSKI